MKSAVYSRGFSIVELVIVILVVGIIAAVGTSRLLRADVFDVITAREQIVSILRTAQQRAIGHEDVVLTLQPNGNNVSVSLEDGAGSLIVPVTVTVAAGILHADIDILASCSTPPDTDNILTAVKPLLVEYDALGNLLRGGVIDGNPAYPTDIEAAVRICLNNDPATSICISAAGYAYVGDCSE